MTRLTCGLYQERESIPGTAWMARIQRLDGSETRVEPNVTDNNNEKPMK